MARGATALCLRHRSKPDVEDDIADQAVSADVPDMQVRSGRPAFDSPRFGVIAPDMAELHPRGAIQPRRQPKARDVRQGSSERNGRVQRGPAMVLVIKTSRRLTRRS